VPNIKNNVSEKQTILNNDRKFNYIGCWSGMGGGKVKITKNKVYDLGSNENTQYKEIEIKPEKNGQAYLLETNGDFKKSFLSKYILIHFRNDGLIWFNSYRSYEKYKNDDIKGEGTFGPVECKEIE
jgi:hypothetical protein